MNMFENQYGNPFSNSLQQISQQEYYRRELMRAMAMGNLAPPIPAIDLSEKTKPTNDQLLLLTEEEE